MNSPLSTHDWNALRVMSLAVSFFTPEQFACWSGQSVPTARRTMRKLEHVGFTKRIQIHSRKIPMMTGPFLRWHPGQPEPDFGKLSYFAKQRHRDLPPQVMTAFVATKLTLRQFNVRRKSTPKPAHQTHEYGLTQTFIYAARRWPRLVPSCWRNEITFADTRGFREKVEDAHLVNPRNGCPMLCIEYVGQYSQNRLRGLHGSFQERKISYLLF